MRTIVKDINNQPKLPLDGVLEEKAGERGKNC